MFVRKQLKPKALAGRREDMPKYFTRAFTISIFLITITMVLSDVRTGKERYFKTTGDLEWPYQTTMNALRTNSTGDTLFFHTLYLSDTLLSVGDTFRILGKLTNYTDGFLGIAQIDIVGFSGCSILTNLENTKYEGFFPKDSSIILQLSGVIRLEKSLQMSQFVYGNEVADMYNIPLNACSVNIKPRNPVDYDSADKDCHRIYALDAVVDYYSGTTSLAHTYGKINSWLPAIHSYLFSGDISELGFTRDEVEYCDDYLEDIRCVMERNQKEYETENSRIFSSGPLSGFKLNMSNPRYWPQFSKQDSVAIIAR